MYNMYIVHNMYIVLSWKFLPHIADDFGYLEWRDSPLYMHVYSATLYVRLMYAVCKGEGALKMPYQTQYTPEN